MNIHKYNILTNTKLICIIDIPFVLKHIGVLILSMSTMIVIYCYEILRIKY